MTLDERTLALIHGDIDGVLDADERAELARLAESDPAVRTRHDEMLRLQRRLAAVEPLEPPLGLKTAIMANLAASQGGSRRAVARWFAPILGSTGLRATALAAAAVVVVALAWPFIGDGGTVDPADALGTIGAGAPAGTDDGFVPHPNEITGAGIVFDGADGEVRVAPMGDGRWQAELVIEAEQPMRVEIGTGAAELVDAVAVEGPSDALRHDGERLIWTVAGRSGIRLTLAVAETTTLEIHGIRAEAGIGSARIPIGPR